MTEPPSPSTQAPPPQVILIVGSSYSGKTTIARELLRKTGRKAYVVNGPPLEKEAGFRKIDYEKCEDLRDCGLLFEDQIATDEAQFKTILRQVNWGAHHAGCTPCVVICHSILNTRAYRLMPYCTQIIVTLAKTGIKSLLSVLDYFSVDKEVRDEYKRQFLATEDEYGFFVFDPRRRTFERGEPMGKTSSSASTSSTPRSSGKSASSSSSAAAARRSVGSLAPSQQTVPISRYLEIIVPESRRRIAQLLFDLIYPAMPEDVRKGGYYTLTLHSKKTDKEVVVSIVDYLDCLTSEKKRVSSQMLGLHAYVKRAGVHLPRCLVINRQFH